MIDDFRPVNRPGKSLPATQNQPSKDSNTNTTYLTPTDIASELSPASSTLDPTPSSNAIAQGTPQITSSDDKEHHKLNKKALGIIIGVLIVLVGGGVAGWYLTRPAPKGSHIAAKITVTQPAISTPMVSTVPSELSGLPVNPVDNKNPVTGVMIENSTFARPQSGLGSASVVFEALAEGGITRFMALYQDTAPTNVGPIRSVRPYYEQWALGFDAGIAHVGGSPDGLADLKTWGVRDLDEFYNGSSYHRITTREAPHNVYTGIPTLTALEVSKGYTSSTFTPFPRKPDSPSKTPNATIIGLTLSSADYNVLYEYNSATNSYYRSEGGAPQFDANTNLQLQPKVVIAMVIPESNGALDSSDAYYSEYQVIGSGPVYVFQDGTVTTGTWTKSSNTSQITFTNASGAPIKLNAGQTWLTAIASTSGVSYST